MSSGMTRRIILIVCLGLAALALLLSFVYTPPDRPSVSKQQDTSSPPYTIKTYQGFVAVFTNDSDVPEQVTGIRAELLPLQDQLDLAKGIPVYSSETLSALLEDFDS